MPLKSSQLARGCPKFEERERVRPQHDRGFGRHLRHCGGGGGGHASAILPDDPRAIAYLFTTFPQSTETFLQREITGMQARGVPLRLYSLWGGRNDFNGQPVVLFPKWKLIALLWMIPFTALRHPRLFGELMGGLVTRRAPSWINFWENMLGAGFACLYAGEFRRNPPAHIHAAWSGGPATAAWLLWRLNGQCFSAGAHAYDIYGHGGDWWLREKLAAAVFVHTSTEMGRRTLRERGVAADKIHVIRRSLTTLPPLKPLRTERSPLRLLCVARLVPKKGLDRQLQIYAALQAAGVAFEARIAGEGPLRGALAAQIADLGLQDRVTLLGHRPQKEIWELLTWADALLHTGVVAADGDRDGLPNVIPEAMSAGVVVVTSPAAATTEAVTDGVTGFVAAVEEPAQWVAALQTVGRDDALIEPVRTAARRWVEENFDAARNAEKLHALFIRNGTDTPKLASAWL